MPQSTPPVPPAPIPVQIAMTLSAMAATAATPRPSGESLEAQGQRMLQGVWEQMSRAAVLKDGVWRLVWLGLGPDNGNMAYIACTLDGSNQFAVAVRGTVDNPVDTMEDLDVGTVVPFTAGGSPTPVGVSAGAMAAFTQIVNAPGVAITGGPGGPEQPDLPFPLGGTLVQALTLLLGGAPASPPPTVLVTGHSLGGCVATMLGPYLKARSWGSSAPQFSLVTFAAPTAGPQSFADYLDSLAWSLYGRYTNAWDLVPLAWSDVTGADQWYPSPGPHADDEVRLLLTEIDALRKGNVYVQPAATPDMTLNADYASGLRDQRLIRKTTADFLGQVAFQHANATYLTLLGAPLLIPGPVVTGVQPTFGAGGTPFTVTGSGFSAESVLDFGPIPCTGISVAPSGTTITGTVPDGAGIVDVRVTNNLGTSPAVPLGRFAYGGPAPLVVSEVDPDEARGGHRITVTGSGFVEDATTVHFKDTQADHVRVEHSTLLTVTAPPRGLLDPKTQHITVTVGVATSPTSANDEFTYKD